LFTLVELTIDYADDFNIFFSTLAFFDFFDPDDFFEDFFEDFFDDFDFFEDFPFDPFFSCWASPINCISQHCSSSADKINTLF
jgi:hypothetical protein